MSEQNYFGMVATETMKNHPEVFSLDGLDEKLKATQKRIAEVDAANKLQRNTAQGTNLPRVEYNRLRNQWYELQQTAKDTEIRLNDASATVHHFEVIVADLLKQKKAATAANLLGEERSCEHQLLVAENDLLTAREALLRWQKTNASAARLMRTFEGHARIAELKKELGL